MPHHIGKYRQLHLFFTNDDASPYWYDNRVKKDNVKQKYDCRIITKTADFYIFENDEKLYLQYHDENEKYLIFDITVFNDPNSPAGRFQIY